MSAELIKARSRACAFCPYRLDAPSGVWAASEYAKLSRYDGGILEQAVAGATACFHCHSTPSDLCSGWVACHGPGNLLALRIHSSRMDPSVWGYTTTVPVHPSGQAACEHGTRDIEDPSAEATAAVAKILAVRPDVQFG